MVMRRKAQGARLYHNLRAPEIAQRCTDRTIFVQPIGAIEQHGPHLPLGTDLLVLDATVAAAVERWGEELDLWLLPSLAYSKSDEHAWAPGTVWLETETMLAVLKDIGRSLAATPAKKLALLNGHGGNSALLDVACRDLRRLFGLQTFLVHPFLPPDHGGAGDQSEAGLGIHAGLEETSLLLYLFPDLVDGASGAAQLPKFFNQYRHIGLGGPVRVGWLSNDLTATGVIGDPTGATAEKGKVLFEAMVAILGDYFAEVAKFQFQPATDESFVPQLS